MPKILTRKERFVFIALFIATVSFGAAWRQALYLEKTVAVPAYGGAYTEALAGEPKFINPLLAPLSDVDRDIAALVYSGLMKYDAQGNIIGDLAERYEISTDGKEYIFYLKKNIQWHDGKPFQAEDVLFTVSAITNQEYGSPLRLSWQGVRAEKITEDAVKIILPAPYAQFLERAMVGILPAHIWENIAPNKANLADANLKPTGTGPYRFTKFTKDKSGNIISYLLSANEYYGQGGPYIKTIKLFFFSYEDEALNAYKEGKVMGVANVSPTRKAEIAAQGKAEYALRTPKYFAVFFNQNRAKPLTDKAVRAAFAAATDKDAIVREVLAGNGIAAHSSILPWIKGYRADLPQTVFSATEAEKILEKAGWKDGDGDGILEKKIGGDTSATPLEITLTTSDFPDLIATAEMLKAQWERVGAKVHIETYNTDELKSRIIKPRKYDALVFGETLSLSADPFVFWHSSQKKDPGLNLSLYDNKETDKLLESIRESSNAKEREKDLGKFQEIVAGEIPALFLFSPYYLYAVDTKVKGISAEIINIPAQRFNGIEQWYIATKRIEKNRQ